MAKNVIAMTQTNYRFYDEDGAHLHQIFRDGEWRPLIGTSSVTGVLAKNLTYWASGLAVAELGWTPINDSLTRRKMPLEPRIASAGMRLEEIKKMEVGEYLALLDNAYSAHAKNLKKTAQGGTDLHYLLEQYVKECIERNSGVPLSPIEETAEVIIPFIDWSVDNVEKFLWSEGYCFDEDRAIGGISDCGAILKDGTSGIIDFKSAKTVYDSHFFQISGYDIQLSKNGLLGKNGEVAIEKLPVFTWYAVVPFGAPEFRVEMRYDVERLKKGFDACLCLFKLTELNH